MANQRVADTVDDTHELAADEVGNNLAELIPRSETIPNIISALDRVSVASLRAEVGTDPLRLSSVDVRVELDLEWPIVKGKEGKDLVKLNGLGLQLSVNHYASEWEVSPYLTGRLTLAGGTLSGIVDLIEKSFCSCWKLARTNLPETRWTSSN